MVGDQMWKEKGRKCIAHKAVYIPGLAWNESLLFTICSSLQLSLWIKAKTRFNSFYLSAAKSTGLDLPKHHPAIHEVSIPHTEIVPHCCGTMKAFYYDRKAKTECGESCRNTQDSFPFQKLIYFTACVYCWFRPCLEGPGVRSMKVTVLHHI